MYESETDGVAIRVTPTFMPQESEPDEGKYFWAYTIEIENRSQRLVQLLTRYWRISSADGTQEVAGDGVVGKQPVIRPGEIHRYTSGVPLTSPSGMMGGHYGMVETESGRAFDVTIPTFALDTPMSTERAN
jgi:ApaG protein